MATFEFEGTKIVALSQEDLELGELAFIKEHFGITGLVSLENGMGDMDPDAWRAILITSIRRTQPDIDPDHEGIESVAILPLVQEMNRERIERIEAEEKAGGDRPTKAPRRRSSPVRSGTSS